MKPCINEDIKDNMLYLAIQEQIKAYMRDRYYVKDLEDYKFITLDCSEDGEYIICLWTAEPNSEDELYWSETISGSCGEYELNIKTLSGHEEDFVDIHWKKLMWRLKKEN